MDLYTGIYAAALTPMHEDFSCNDEAFAHHCRDLMNRGCKGILVFGTTGEGPSFSINERKKALKNLVKSGIAPQRLIIGTSFCAIDDVVKLTSFAICQQCSAVLIVPPFFYKNVNDAGVIAFYREIIKRVAHPDLKILLYHIPQCSGVPITLNIIKTLNEEFPHNVIGIKESEGNLYLTKEILLKFPNFKVFTGKDSHISEFVQSGAAGGITGLTNAYPELVNSLYEFGKDRQKPDNNSIIQHIIECLKNYPIFPAIKNIVEKQKGAAWRILRPPLLPLTEKQSQELCRALSKIFNKYRNSK